MQDIISYSDVVHNEGFNIQHGMNYRPQGKPYSVLLMSVRKGAPYNDIFDEQTNTLIYEGHDVNRNESRVPKRVDQPMHSRAGGLTRNGRFYRAARDFQEKKQTVPERVRIYDKIGSNIWSNRGWFNLVSADYVYSEREKRKVFRYRLEPTNPDQSLTAAEIEEFEFSRRIPTEVKREVYKRDEGKCIQCGSKENLHFDHILPWSKGGSSNDGKNVQILCGKHNLQKSDNIL